MKVKSLLNVCNATKIEILVKKADGLLISHDINMLRGEINPRQITDNWIEYTHWVQVPADVLNKNIDLVSTSHTGKLNIYTK